MPSTQATRHGDTAERWIRRLARLEPAHQFYPPPAVLRGAALEDRVAQVLDTLCGQADDHSHEVAQALRRLYVAER